MIRALVFVLLVEALYGQTRDNVLPTSPCPSTFSYEGRMAEQDRWYGVVWVTTDSPLTGLRIDVRLNRPAMVLGNWIGDVSTHDNIRFTILNLDKRVTPGPPTSVRIFAHFPNSDEIPAVETIALNGRQICPEQRDNNPQRPVYTSDRFQESSNRRPYPYNEDEVSVRSTTASDVYNSNNNNNEFQNAVTKIPTNSYNGNANNPRRPSNSGDTSEFQAPSTTRRAGDDRYGSQPTRPPGYSDKYDSDGYQPPSNPKRPSNAGESYQQRTTTKLPFTNDNRYVSSQTPRSPVEDTYTVRPPASLNSGHDSNGNQQGNRGKPNRNSINNGNRNNENRQGAGSRVQSPDDEVEWGPPARSTPRREELTTEALGSSKAVCGKLHVSATPLITHGQTTSRGQWPWHAALYQAKSADLSYICGGSLVSPSVVITAAHCVAKLIGNRGVDPDTLVIYLGKYHLKLWSEGGVQNKQVAEVHIHPAYNSSDFRSDVAVLVLSSPAELTQYVSPVCLWGSRSIDLRDIENREGYVVGWGYDERGDVTEELMMARMPVVAQETCVYSYREFFSHFTNDKTYCAGFRNGTSVCNGDSGGGMVFPEQQPDGSKVWHLRGLVSISVSREDKRVCDTKHYVVFADLAKYQDWLKRYIK